MTRKISRKFLIFLLGSLGIGIAAHVVLLNLIDAEKIRLTLETMFHEKTGGTLKIESLDYGVFRGFTATDISVAKDEKTPPFATFKKIELDYSLWTLIYGTLSINKALISGGQLTIQKVDGILNFQTLLPSPPQNKPEENSPPPKIGALISLINDKFLIPIRISISDIGFSDFSIHYQEVVKNKITLSSQIEHLSILLNGNAFHRSLKLNLDAAVKSLNFANHTYKNLNSSILLDFYSDPSRHSLVLERLDLKLMDLFHVKNSLVMHKVPDQENSLGYKLDSNVLSDLSQLEKSSIPLPNHLQLYGKTSTTLTASGTLDLDALKTMTPQNALTLFPQELLIKAELDKIKASLSEGAIQIKPLSLVFESKISKNRQNKLNGQTTLHTAWDGLNFLNKNLRAEVSGFTLDLKGNASYPRSQNSHLQLGLKALTILQNQEDPPIALPLEINVSAKDNFPEDQQSITTQVKLEELLQLASEVTCKSLCSTFTVSLTEHMPSLEKFWLKLKPMISTQLLPKFIPESLIGSQNLSLKIAGNLDAPLHKLKGNPKLSNLRHNLALKLDLEQFKLPSNFLEITKSQLAFTLSGSNYQTESSLKTELSQVKSRIITAAKKNIQTNLRGINFSQSFKSSHVDILKIKNPTQIKILTKSALSVTQLELDGILKKALNQVSLDCSLEYINGRYAKLHSFIFHIPDFKARFDLRGESRLSESLSPENISAQASFAIKDFPQDYIPNFFANGSVESQISLISEDLDLLKLSGKLTTTNINMKSAKESSLDLDLRNMTGTIPINVALSLKEFLKKSTAKEIEDSESSDNEDIQGIAQDYIDRNVQENLQNHAALIEDYPGFRNYLPSHEPLTIEYFRMKNFEFTKSEFEIALLDESLFIHHFATQFLDGNIQANASFNFKKGPKSLKTSLHITRINTEKLLKDKNVAKKKSFSILGAYDPYLDATANIHYDLQYGDLSGGFFITSIGKDQLRSILYYLDPTDSDTAVSAIKTALNVGEVKLVSVPIKNGEIGFDVDLRLLSAPIPTPKIQGFPIAKLLDNYVGAKGGQENASH